MIIHPRKSLSPNYLSYHTTFHTFKVLSAKPKLVVCASLLPPPPPWKVLISVISALFVTFICEKFLKGVLQYISVWHVLVKIYVIWNNKRRLDHIYSEILILTQKTFTSAEIYNLELITYSFLRHTRYIIYNWS